MPHFQGVKIWLEDWDGNKAEEYWDPKDKLTVPGEKLRYIHYIAADPGRKVMLKVQFTMNFFTRVPKNKRFDQLIELEVDGKTCLSKIATVKEDLVKGSYVECVIDGLKLQERDDRIVLRPLEFGTLNTTTQLVTTGQAARPQTNLIDMGTLTCRCRPVRLTSSTYDAYPMASQGVEKGFEHDPIPTVVAAKMPSLQCIGLGEQTQVQDTSRELWYDYDLIPGVEGPFPTVKYFFRSREQLAKLTSGWPGHVQRYWYDPNRPFKSAAQQSIAFSSISTSVEKQSLHAPEPPQDTSSTATPSRTIEVKPASQQPLPHVRQHSALSSPAGTTKAQQYGEQSIVPQNSQAFVIKEEQAHDNAPLFTKYAQNMNLKRKRSAEAIESAPKDVSIVSSGSSTWADIKLEQDAAKTSEQLESEELALEAQIEELKRQYALDRVTQRRAELAELQAKRSASVASRQSTAEPFDLTKDRIW